MAHRRTPTSARWAAAAFACLLTAAFAPPVGADHTNPNAPLTQIVDVGDEGVRTGAGTWTHIKNFAGTTGTDLEFFHRDGELYVAAGQLGQAGMAIAGQRLIKLVDKEGNADNPVFVADHGSGSCGDVTNARSTTGLQHDTQTTPRAVNILAPGAKPDADLVIDTVDALGRCHDNPGGGLEFIDVSGLGTEDGFEPREIHLTRHNGYSHTVTVDATRPWIVYNSTSNFGTNPDSENPMGIGPAWIDVMDIRTCLGLKGKSLEDKRAACRPKVFRIPFEYEWATQQKEEGGLHQPSGCHDITARPGKIYCAALNATIVLDVSGLTAAQGPDVPMPNDPRGDIGGKPLPCTVTASVPANATAPSGAMVTDCALGAPNDVPLMIKGWVDAGRPAATGWKYVGHVNHPGRNCGNDVPASDCNSNLVTPSSEGVAVSHEADPSPDGRWLFVTDERGGGIVPPGAMCLTSLDNPYGNGGMHVFDMTKTDEDGRFQYAEKAGGGKAVFISQNRIVSPTFCTIHVIEQIPDEQRIIAAWYSQGVKVLDYEIDENGQWTFTEVSGFAYLPNDIWAAETFKIVDEGDGNRTYYMVSNDVLRGVDVFSWTGPKGPPIQGSTTPTGPGGGDDDDDDDGSAPPPTRPRTGPREVAATGADLWLLALAFLAFPLAVVVRRRYARA